MVRNADAAIVGEDGCPAFACSVDFDDSQIGREFHWGVIVAGPFGANMWGIPTELDRADDDRRHRVFVLEREPRPAELPLHVRAPARCTQVLGECGSGSAAAAKREVGLRFRVWAPNARAVEVVFAKPGTVTSPTMAAAAIRPGPH